jgi:hypothetical protein
MIWHACMMLSPNAQRAFGAYVHVATFVFETRHARPSHATSKAGVHVFHACGGVHAEA